MEKSDFHSVSSLAKCRLIEIERHTSEDDNGTLSVVENTVGYPFDIQRVYYLYDIPGDSDRGGHSHRRLQQLIIAVSGAFDVVLTDGADTMRVTLNRPYKALYVAPGIWRTLENFSSGSVCLVLASLPYDEAEYVRDYEEFCRLTAHKKSKK